MSLRLRLIVAATVAVAVAVVLSAAGAYLVTSHELRAQVDQSLSRRLDVSGRFRVVARPETPTPPPVPDGLRRLPSEVATVQVVTPSGQVELGNGTEVAVTGSDRQLAAGAAGTRFRDDTVDGIHLRVATRGLGNGRALLVAAPLDAVDRALHRLLLLFALLALAGVAAAAGLSLIVARAALAPVERLTAAAERVATTRDLTATIDVHGVDEIARLSRTLNAMLVAVDESQREQRRLVADASHELRTPLTSLRTNLEVLARSHEMPAADRQELLADLIAQVVELGTLVGHLVELDRTDTSAEEPEPIAFDEVVGAAVARARRNSPALRFDASLEPCLVMGRRGPLERAVANLLDNAAKWSPPGAAIEVALAQGVLRVRDHGPGIDPADAPHVFDRFYRSAAARGLPGSGLGLAIVKQAAEDHGGEAWVEPGTGGGTVAALRLCPIPADPSGTAPGLQSDEPSLRLALSTSISAQDASRQPSTAASLPGSSDL